MLVRRMARPMLAAVFVASGIDTLRNPGPRVEAAAPLVARGGHALPNEITDHVSTDPDTLVKINAAVQVGGGLLLATGKLPRLAALALAGSIVPTTLARHAFWAETAPAAKAAQRTQFLKNVGLLGGLLIAAVDTEGKPSVAWRTRRSAEHAQAALTAVQRGPSRSTTGDALREAAHTAAERGSALAAEWVDEGSTRGAKLARKARGNADSWARHAADRAEELTEEGTRRGRRLAEKARQRANNSGVTAADRVQELVSAYR